MRWVEGSYDGRRKKPPSDDAVADGGNQRRRGKLELRKSETDKFLAAL
jgi:hypothetical protein